MTKFIHSELETSSDDSDKGFLMKNKLELTEAVD